MKKFYIYGTFCLLLGLAIFALQNSMKSRLQRPGEAFLQWDAGSSSISGYRIYYGQQSHQYEQPKGGGVDVGLTETPGHPNYTVKNLKSGQTYYFAVTTYDAAGIESNYSEEVSKRVQ